MIACSVGGREMALNAGELLRFVELKSLVLRGDAAILAGTVAARLHPDAAGDDDSDGEADDEDEEDESEADDEEGGEPAVKRGATLKLLRRLDPGAFYFRPGSARKASGSYYTPTAMVDDLVRHSLGPLVHEKSAADIERLRVIDIACGSAQFLVGVARFLGRALQAAHRHERGSNPPPDFHPQRALTSEVRARWETDAEAWCKRRVVERCLYGVDLNPAAVQLAQVALWIESLAGDRPLGFFAHHVRNGNSLLGSWLNRYDKAPDPQLTPLPDRHTRGLFEAELGKRLHDALEERRLIDAPLPPEAPGDTPDEYAYKEDRLRRADAATAQARLLLDCAAPRRSCRPSGASFRCWPRRSTSKPTRGAGRGGRSSTRFAAASASSTGSSNSPRSFSKPTGRASTRCSATRRGTRCCRASASSTPASMR